MGDPIKLSRGVRYETGQVRSERFDREFRPLTRYRRKPVAEACRDSVELDQQSKERMAELVKAGTGYRFHELLEERELHYYRSFPWMAATGGALLGGGR